MSLKFNFISLSFLKKEDQILEQIRNTVILKYFFDFNNRTSELSDLIKETQYGYNASALDTGKNKFLRISDIKNGGVNWKNVPYCNCKDTPTYLLNHDDLLIARTGGTTGKSFLIKNPPLNAIYAGYLIRIRANDSATPQYLNLFLNSYIYWSQIFSLNKGEFRPSVNAKTLKKLRVPFCTKDQQRDAFKLAKGEKVLGYEQLALKIENTLEAYQKGIRLESLIGSQKTLVGQLKETILQEAIQGKLTHDWRAENPVFINGEYSVTTLLKNISAAKVRLISENKIKKGKKQKSIDLGNIKPEIPREWKFTDLDDITQIITDGTHQTPTYTDKGKIFLSAQNVKPFKFMPENHKFVSNKSYLEYTKGKKPEKGDLLVGRVGSKGETAVIDQEIDFAFYVSLGFIKTFKDFTSPDYLAIVMNSRYGNLYATGNMSSLGASAGNFNLGRIRSFPIPLPPLEEQKAIVTKVADLMEKCKALEMQIVESEQYTQMLMQAVLKEAFEGKEVSKDKTQVLV